LYFHIALPVTLLNSQRDEHGLREFKDRALYEPERQGNGSSRVDIKEIRYECEHWIHLA
jgi:hypothetical protein